MIKLSNIWASVARRRLVEGPRAVPILGAMLSGGPTGYGGETAPRILIVDDDPNLLVLLADQLRADGFEIQTARDGDEALRRLRTSAGRTS